MTDEPNPIAPQPKDRPQPAPEEITEQVVPPGMRPAAWWRIGLIALLIVVAVLLVMQGGWWTVQDAAS